MLLNTVFRPVVVGVRNIVVDEVPTGVVNNLTTTLPPAVIEVFLDRMTQTYTEALTTFLAVGLTDRLISQILPTLEYQLAIDIGTKVDDPVFGCVPKIMKKLTRILGIMLSKAITHSVIGSLSHTMTHSPQADYYCYFCCKYKKYCQYCEHAPQQLYYQMYYGGFYSSYYSDYYMKYYSQKYFEESKIKKARAARDKQRSAFEKMAS